MVFIILLFIFKYNINDMYNACINSYIIYNLHTIFYLQLFTIYVFFIIILYLANRIYANYI